MPEKSSDSVAKTLPSESEASAAGQSPPSSTGVTGNTPVDSERLAEASGPQNLTQVDGPSFLMCPPLSFTAAVPNNAWMDDFTPEARQVNPRTAMRQFQALYHFVASRALVSLLPSPSSCGLQDLVFTANLGLVLEHLEDRNTVVLANFSSEPRVGELEVGLKYFQDMGYRTFVPKGKFEGEAELKHLQGNVYVGGYGMRSDTSAFEELEEQFDMKIIKVRETDPYLYHLDCSVFPLSKEKTIVATEAFDASEVKALEKVTEIIDVPKSAAVPGLCNSVRLGNYILNGSNIHELSVGTDDYRMELAKNRLLEDIAAENGFEVAFFNLSEFIKGGGALSCMIMHLNRYSYQFRLI